MFSGITRADFGIAKPSNTRAKPNGPAPSRARGRRLLPDATKRPRPVTKLPQVQDAALVTDPDAAHVGTDEVHPVHHLRAALVLTVPHRLVTPRSLGVVHQLTDEATGHVVDADLDPLGSGPAHLISEARGVRERIRRRTVQLEHGDSRAVHAQIAAVGSELTARGARRSGRLRPTLRATLGDRDAAAVVDAVRALDDRAVARILRIRVGVLQRHQGVIDRVDQISERLRVGERALARVRIVHVQEDRVAVGRLEAQVAHAGVGEQARKLTQSLLLAVHRARRVDDPAEARELVTPAEDVDARVDATRDRRHLSLRELGAAVQLLGALRTPVTHRPRAAATDLDALHRASGRARNGVRGAAVVACSHGRRVVDGLGPVALLGHGRVETGIRARRHAEGPVATDLLTVAEDADQQILGAVTAVVADAADLDLIAVRSIRRGLADHRGARRRIAVDRAARAGHSLRRAAVVTGDRARRERGRETRGAIEGDRRVELGLTARRLVEGTRAEDLAAAQNRDDDLTRAIAAVRGEALDRHLIAAASGGRNRAAHVVHTRRRLAAHRAAGAGHRSGGAAAVGGHGADRVGLGLRARAVERERRVVGLRRARGHVEGA